MAKRKAHRFGIFELRGARVSGWGLPVNRDPEVKWKDRTEGDDEPQRRPWPEMRCRERKR